MVYILRPLRYLACTSGVYGLSGTLRGHQLGNRPGPKGRGNDGPHIPIGKGNINFLEEFAYEQQIESVPCLLITKDGKVHEKVYAFKSVQNLYEKLIL